MVDGVAEDRVLPHPAGGERKARPVAHAAERWTSIGIRVPSRAGYSSSVARANVLTSTSGALGECHFESFFDFQSSTHAEGMSLPGSTLRIVYFPSCVVLT